MTVEIDTDPGRVDRDVVWEFVSTAVHWARRRTRADVETQLDVAWRVAGAYRGPGAVRTAMACGTW